MKQAIEMMSILKLWSADSSFTGSGRLMIWRRINIVSKYPVEMPTGQRQSDKGVSPVLYSKFLWTSKNFSNEKNVSIGIVCMLLIVS